jgi:VIT1/CCC1 family predicted Fe2+/Mn2+ transporter
MVFAAPAVGGFLDAGMTVAAVVLHERAECVLRPFRHRASWPAMNQIEASEFHNRLDPHRHASRLSELILGGQDGLVNVLGVILGVGAATDAPRLVLVAGLAAAFAESVSMAAVAYTSTRAQHALYQSELARERRHIARVPELEREEIRQLFRTRGFEGALLDRIVETITANPDVWVEVMMAEELHLRPLPRSGSLRAALVVGVAALVGSLVPLAPFVFLRVAPAMWTAVAVGAAALFAVGVYQAVTTVGRWWKSGIQLMSIGTVAALAGWLIGTLFKVAPPP